jgi:cobyrinic acid a,c-diamide synthase
MSARLVIAGVASNVGKTTLTVGLLAALKRRGLDVRPFKAGPDYIDPTYHACAAGVPSRNLDTWLLPAEALRASFARATTGSDLALIEGVMGLYDGAEYLSDAGSTAALAKMLDAPVALVLDVRAQARSAAAVALGFQRFDPDLHLVGFLLNRVGSPGHAAGVRAAIEAETGLPVFGAVPGAEGITIPDRHLGLLPANERSDASELRDLVDNLAEIVAESCDLDALVACARAAPPLASVSVRRPVPQPGALPVIAIARDRAFSFYYEDNLDLLHDAGAEIAFFSPLVDRELPPHTAALYLGGGFPEVYAADLAANAPMRALLRAVLADGMPCYAECGGLMYLTESLVDHERVQHPMVGVIPGRAVMQPRRARLGYATVRAEHDTILLKTGETIRGHEFHYSTWEEIPGELAHPYALMPRWEHDVIRLEGFARDAILASWIHLHFGAMPSLAERFVTAARHYDESRRASIARHIPS